ncbi:translation initiation factor [Candidatus Woesearchaeota archaeon]|nr:translation initiation factor [Candidatus Woesearchaeota archaeon]
MGEICPKCGLVKELCVCETIAREAQEIAVRVEKRAFGKKYTVIQGIDTKEIDIRDVARKLKSALACGGTAKDGKIELQGDHKNKAKDLLIKIGFAPESVKVM